MSASRSWMLAILLVSMFILIGCGGDDDDDATGTFGGGDDDAAHGPLDQPLEQRRGAALVDRDVALDRVHALAHPDLGGEVDDAVHAAQRARQRRLVAHVAAQQLDLRVEIPGPRPRAVDLRDQAVEGAHPVAARQERAGEVSADEAGAAGDQDGFRHVVPPPNQNAPPARARLVQGRAAGEPKRRGRPSGLPPGRRINAPGTETVAAADGITGICLAVTFRVRRDRALFAARTEL